MKKTLERLRQQKAKAVDRMQTLNALAAKENRELNAAEKVEYEARKTEAEELSASITQLEAEVAEFSASTSTANEEERLERERLGVIDQICAAFLARGDVDAAFVTRLKADKGNTVEKARTALIDHLAAKSERNPIQNQHKGAYVTADQRDKRREGMMAATLYRAEPQTFAAYKEKAAEYRGYTLIDCARECMEAAGVSTKGMSGAEIAMGALRAPGEFTQFFSGAHTTSDLPNILANIATKSLRQAYEAAPPTFRAVARQVGVSDFKTAKSVNLSDIAALRKVNEKGEIKRTFLSDSGESYSIATYADVVAISRPVIINDDLRTLVRVPGALGQAAARTESDVAWGIITANAAMSDNVAIFHATHKNLTTGAGSAFADASLATLRAAMRLQTAPKGTILNYVPRYVVGPAALEHTILKYVNPMQLAASSAANVVPQWVTQLTPVIEGRLDANSTTAFYLVAEGDGLIYCYLDGQEGVYTETRNGFDVDGVEIKARLDFGAAMVEYRTWQKSAGA